MYLTLAYPYLIYGPGSWTDYKYTSGEDAFTPTIGVREISRFYTRFDRDFPGEALHPIFS